MGSERDALRTLRPRVALEHASVGVLGHDVEKRPLSLQRRDDVVDGGKRTVRPRNLPAALAQRVEGLRTRHLVHEMQADEQLRLSCRQVSNGMEIPYLS